MYAPQISALLPARILLVSAHESGGAADMSALRGLGVSSFALCPSPEQVPAVLADASGNRPFECVVCPHRAKDDTALRLSAVMAGDAQLARFPVLFLSGDGSGVAALSATGAVTLTRPYAPNDLADALQKALSPLRKPLSAPVLPETAAPKTKTAEKAVTTSDLLRAGHSHLQAGRLDVAAKTFAVALQRSDDLPEACLGMAGIERARDNPQQAGPWIVRAAAGYMRRNDQAGFAALLPHLPQGTHNTIFAQEASALMSQGLYRQACRSFLEGAQKTGEPLHALIARVCAFSDAPRRRMEIICDAFEASGHVNTAKALRVRLLYEEYDPGPERPSWLANFPLLQEIVCVAGWTAQAWRHA